MSKIQGLLKRSPFKEERYVITDNAGDLLCSLDVADLYTKRQAEKILKSEEDIGSRAFKITIHYTIGEELLGG